ncbi:MAG: alanine racemase [Candidatus Binatia bacterium]|nr:alanine racemase [Candidatus Binatia bacterium]
MMSSHEVRLASAVIDAAALCHNVQRLRSRLRLRTRVLAVVKADGYGHGARIVAPVLAQAGVDAFGVATVWEGVELRALGIQQPVLVLAGAHESDLKVAAEENLAIALLDRDHLREIEHMSVRRRLRVHVKVDNGTGRLGTDVEQLGARCSRNCGMRAMSSSTVFFLISRTLSVWTTTSVAPSWPNFDGP